MPLAAEPISDIKMPILIASMPILPSTRSATIESGTFESANIFHGITPKETTAIKMLRIPTMIVPIIIALGIVLSGSRVSSAR